MKPHFEQLADALCTAVPGTDRVSLYYAAESSDFIRFNHAQVRQATHVSQVLGTVEVYRGLRHLQSTLTLTGDVAADVGMLRAERDALVAELADVPDDEHLLLPQECTSTTHDAPGALPSATALIDAVTREAAGADLVGFYAGGPVARGFADSRGQRNWHCVESFHFEWCLYRLADEAVKTTYAGTRWDDADFAVRMGQARHQLALLGRPRKTLAPGAWRACFSPTAVADLLGVLGWGGFGLRAARTGVSTLARLHLGQEQFHPSIQLTEATTQGIAPCFQADGFVKPDGVALVRDGRLAEVLASARSAREYGVPANGASPDEAPESLAIAPGSLPQAEALRQLGTGVYVSNVHYLNYSDRSACRVTGMTRFACFWVENGELVAPLAVMRFDDSLLRMFGPGLVALTDAAEFLPDNASYGSRQLRSVTAPGAVVDGFRLTL